MYNLKQKIGMTGVRKDILSIRPRTTISKVSSYNRYQHFNHSNTQHSAQRVHCSVLYKSRKKRRIFPYTALTDWL